MGGDTIEISFDMKGSAMDGGVIFPELISEGAGGATVSNLLDTIAVPTADWTTYSYSVDAAADVSGGISFQIAIVCGGAPACSNDVYIDNVSVKIKDEGGGGGGGEAPIVAAPMPMQDEGDVISLFSDSYMNAVVDTWRTDWSAATLTDVTIDGNAMKLYTDLDFVGIEMVSSPQNLEGMTHMHLDVWTPDADSLLVKLVDFGGDGAGGGNDTEGAVTFNAGTTPALVTQTWIGLDIELADFESAGLGSLADVSQIILAATPAGTSTLYVTNVYFYNDGAGGGGGGGAPEVAAPAPTQDAADVISMFSDAYDDEPVDTWRTDWSAATLADIEVAGNATKEYTNLDFVGIEMVSAPLDISGMTHMHIDVWTPNADSFLLKLVDFGGDGAGGGNDTEGPITFNAGSTPPLTKGGWVSLDILLTDMQSAGLGALTDINQLIFAATPAGSATVYVDNVYFYNEEGGGGGGGGDGELLANGDFEAGDLSGWLTIENGGMLIADSTENTTVMGGWSVHAIAGPGNNPVIKQERLAAGTVVPGDIVDIAFNMKGSALAGGVIFPELISEGANGAAVGQLLDTIAVPTAGWTTYVYSPVAGADVTDGITFQIAVVCGADAACSNDVYIDDVSMIIR
jgi:hypothetical protein